MLPFNKLRILFLNVIPGYSISYSSKIGFFNIFRVNTLRVKNSYIGSFNRFVGLRQLELFDSKIGNMNSFKYFNIFSSHKAVIKNKNSFIGSLDLKSSSNLVIQDDSLITHRHYFDLTESILIGSNVVFAGEGTQIWTHGFDFRRVLKSGKITIGKNIYIGSRSLLVPGIRICDNVTIGAGTTVSKSIFITGCYISSQLKKV
jgi:acetyltransferase-like isoleucine patch superfamily enzyme